MTELKNTLFILKTRWREVALILGIEIIQWIPPNFLRPEISNFAKAHSYLYKILLIPTFVVAIAVFIFSLMLFLGFLRTIFSAPHQRTSIIVLLKTGRHFFWRFIGFGILFVIGFWVVSWALFSIAKLFIPISAGFLESARTSPWLFQSCFMATILIFTKPFLFTPALIITFDCKVLKSLQLLKYCKLFEAKELLIIFVVYLANTWLWMFMPKYTVWHIVPSIIKYFISLLIFVMAVRFVTALNLPYDTELSSVNSQGLLKPE